MGDTFNSRRHRKLEARIGGRVEPPKPGEKPTRTLAQALDDYRKLYGREPSEAAVRAYRERGYK